MMKKNYLAPEAEVVTFAKEDVITSSGFLFDWDLPTMDLAIIHHLVDELGDDNCTWEENSEVYRM